MSADDLMMQFELLCPCSKSVHVVLQVYPVSAQREPEKRGQLCAVSPGAACVRTVSFGGRDSVPQPLTSRRD